MQLEYVTLNYPATQIIDLALMLPITIRTLVTSAKPLNIVVDLKLPFLFNYYTDWLRLGTCIRIEGNIYDYVLGMLVLIRAGRYQSPTTLLMPAQAKSQESVGSDKAPGIGALRGSRPDKICLPTKEFVRGYVRVNTDRVAVHSSKTLVHRFQCIKQSNDHSTIVFWWECPQQYLAREPRKM